jgi:hypothetical protein
MPSFPSLQLAARVPSAGNVGASFMRRFFHLQSLFGDGSP